MTTLAQTLEEIKAQFAATLNGRCERAARIALSGAVTRLDDHTWQVGSQSEPGTSYTVTFKLGWQCTCEDFAGTGYSPAPTAEFFGGSQCTCKHILAVGACWVSGEYPAPAPFDLVIATKKTPHTSGPDGKILWFKLTGQEKVEPTKTAHLTDGTIQAKLAKYELVDTEARASQVIRRYRLIAGGA